jgi:hypothetical protein
MRSFARQLDVYLFTSYCYKKKNMTLVVNEIFYSIQGETPRFIFELLESDYESAGGIIETF